MKSLFSLPVFMLFFHQAFCQDVPGMDEYRAFWAKTDAEFRNPEESPLPPEEVANFDSVPRFPYDPKYRVEAVWEEVKRSKPFEFETTGAKKQTYQLVGRLHFTLNGDSLMLPAYRNLMLMRMPGYEDYLFVPFTDKTNGFATYGGGRYLDMTMPVDTLTTVDFNRAYNPYCAYSDRYSCPIPPKESILHTEIHAGAKYDK